MFNLSFNLKGGTMRNHIIVFIVIILITGCNGGQLTAFSSGGAVTGLTVDKNTSLNEVQVGDEYSVQITVHGFNRQVFQTVPFDAVLLLDKSGTMHGAPFQSAKDAAVAFVQLAQSSGANINIAVATFGEGSSVINNLSTNYTTIINNINNLSDADDEETNIERAMGTANNILHSGLCAVRVAILLTDGRPEPDENAQVLVINNTHIPEAQLNAFRYYTIGLGQNIDYALLAWIASSTNGDFNIAESSPDDDGVLDSSLATIYTNLFSTVAHTVVAGQIVLQERVDTSALEIIPDSFEIDNDLPMPSTEDLDFFYSTGEIDIPMGELRSNRLHTIAFMVRNKSCLPVDSPEEFTIIQPNLNTSNVSYLLGSVPTTLPLPPIELTCWKDPDLDIRKLYDSNTNTVTLRLESRFVATTGVDKNIYDISIYEYPSIQYQYIDGSAVPAPDAFIPGPATDLLHWHIDVLHPQEVREFNFRVEQRAYVPRDVNPLHLNAVKDPDGAFSSISYTPAGGARKHVGLPQLYITAYMLDNVLAGRPNLYIDQAFNLEELATLGLTPYDPATDPNMPSGGPAAFAISADGMTFYSNWPPLGNFLKRWESQHIWVDSLTGNGFVSDWSRDNAPHIQSHIDHVKVDPLLTNIWKFIEGQGDLFNQNDVNRIYVQIVNNGQGTSTAITDGIALFIKNYNTNAWDLIQSEDLPAITSRDRIFFELPSGTLQDDHLQQFGPATWNVWTAEFRVEVSVNPNERHTNNNISSERIFVIK
jgi:uncharacterized protein YegL